MDLEKIHPPPPVLLLQPSYIKAWESMFFLWCFIVLQKCNRSNVQEPIFLT